ncbi:MULTISPECIES: AMP-binding protein [unclassified Rhodococcus (in: high G+C Gram-positive bacteria)]|uniref:AMP-binding protein n=1 Tax=unclassified Rhodococcus (in: high G+C Gram-positive bacteria) TaxID=192944 RepID=UPI0015E8CBF4|nr:MULTISPECIES: AMP-binding protein [unclassified Rhodococcus (in: high G+C Gram-positive bacteria)]
MNAQTTYPTYQDLVLKALTRFPERTAVVCGATRLTGRDLHRQVAALMGYLRLNGIDGSSRVALYGPNSSDYLAAQFAIAAIGATYTGLHPMASGPEIVQILDQLRPEVLVVAPGADSTVVEHIDANLAESLPTRLLALDASVLDGSDAASLADFSSSATIARSHPTATASISFTGGTTGKPKGVVRSQSTMATAILTMLSEWEWPIELRFLTVAPLSHAAGLMSLPVLLRGGTVHIHAGFDVDEIHKTIAAERITATFMVPTMIYRLLNEPEPTLGSLGDLELVLYGASAISPERLSEALGRWGQIFMQLYGQVEAPNCISVLRIGDHVTGDLDRLASCGKPTAMVELEIRGDDGSVLGPGQSGEICVRGPLVMDGYLDDPENTADALRDGWLCTGDIGFRDDDGFVHIRDRRKDMIVSGGFNIFAGDVERALSTHSGVRESAVIGIPDADWGEAVIAYVVRRSTTNEQEPDAADLRKHVKTIKGTAWTPKQVYFVESLPLTPLGKPDKKALRAPHWVNEGRGVR